MTESEYSNQRYGEYRELETDLEMLYGTHQTIEPLLRESREDFNPDLADLGRQCLE